MTAIEAALGEAVKKLRLDAHAKQTDDYMAMGIDKRAIAKLLDVSPIRFMRG